MQSNLNDGTEFFEEAFENSVELPTPEAKEPRCKRLSRNATKYERRLAHEQKMARKARLRALQRPTGKGYPIRINRSRKWDEVEAEGQENG